MRAGPLVLTTAMLSCDLVSASAPHFGSNGDSIRYTSDLDRDTTSFRKPSGTTLPAQLDLGDNDIRMSKRGKAVNDSMTRVEIPIRPGRKRRERPLRIPGFRPITGETALQSAALTAASVALHTAAVGSGVLPHPQSAAEGVGYLGLHAVAGSFVYPAVYHATKKAFRQGKECLGPYCRKMYDAMNRPSSEAKQMPGDQNTAASPQLKQVLKKGGRRNAKAMALKSSALVKRSFVHTKVGSYPSEDDTRLARTSMLSDGGQGHERRLVKRTFRREINGKKLLHYGRARRRIRPCRVPGFAPITGQAALKATALTATTLAAHGTAIKFGLLGPVSSIPMGVAVLGAHGVAAGLMAPLAYRASREVFLKAKKCIGPYCGKAYEKVVGSDPESSSAPSQMGEWLSTLKGSPKIDRISKKGGRRVAKVVAAKKAATLVKRSLVSTPPADEQHGSTLLVKRGRQMGGLRVISASRKPFRKRPLPKNDPPAISTDTILRSLKYATTTGVGHTALVGAGLLPAVESAPGLAGYAALHLAVAGVAGPMFYDAAKEPMQKIAKKIQECVGPYCQRMIGQADYAKARFTGGATTFQTPSPTSPITTIMHSSDKGGKRNVKIASRGSSLRKRGVPAGIADPAYLTGVRRAKAAVPLTIDLAPAIRGAKYAAGSAVAHTALVGAGVLPHVTTANGLIGSAAFHTFIAGMIAPHVYDASRKMAYKLSKCAVPFCKKLYDAHVESMSPEMADDLGRRIARLQKAAETPATAQKASSSTQGSTKKARRKANKAEKGKSAMIKRSFDGNAGVSDDQSMWKRANIRAAPKKKMRDIVKMPKKSRTLTPNKAPAISTDSVMNTMKWATATAAAHTALVAGGVATPPGSVPALVGTMAAHVAVSGIAARLAYEASKPAMGRVARRIKSCVGPHCQKLYDHFTGSEITPLSASSI